MATKSARSKSFALDFSPIKEKMSKNEIIQTLVDNVEGIDRKQAKAMLETLGQLIMASVCKKSAGHFALPGILDIKTRNIPAKKIPAIKKGTEVRNPRTGEMVEHPGRKAGIRPATTKLKIRALGQLRTAAL